MKELLTIYLNGEDINSRPDSSPSRWIINFFNWPLEKAEEYTDCIEWVRKNVKPERDKLMGRNAVGTRRATYWWLYAQDANTLFRTIAKMKRVLVKSCVSKHHAFTFLNTGFVPANTVFVFAFEDYYSFAVLQSCFHEVWASENSSRLETRLRYTPMTCFETYPFPQERNTLEGIGEQYYLHRQSIMLARLEGLTKTYNRFHDAEEKSADIRHLRELHQEMDEAVASAYGWANLSLEHGFHGTKQGVRFTISETARRDVLDRLLKLNHQRYAEEKEQGLHNKTGATKKATSKKKTTSKADKKVATLFEIGDDHE